MIAISTPGGGSPTHTPAAEAVPRWMELPFAACVENVGASSCMGRKVMEEQASVMPYAVMQQAPGNSICSRLCRCSGSSPPPKSTRLTDVSAPLGDLRAMSPWAGYGGAASAAASGDCAIEPLEELASAWHSFSVPARAAAPGRAASVRLTTMAGTAMKAVTLCALIRSTVEAALNTGWNT